MPLRWTDNWTPFDDPSPYVDWWRRSVTDPSPKSPLEGGLVTQRAATRLSAPSKASSEEDEDQTAARLPCLDNDVPIARDSRNKGFEAFLTGGGDWRPDPGNLPTIPDDTIIVGVIDTGIALGHNRFREMDGSSRILAAWQQTAIWDSPLGREQPFLPFGREIYQAEIDELLRTHSGGTLGGWLDEDSFNRTTGVLDMARPLGHREVAGRYAHGTHVLDAAAGADPDDPEEADFRRRVKIIAVNLPGSITFGESGTFLDCFMIYAIQRISDVADAVWDKNHPDAAPEARRGYPVVINLSFGKQAGSKTTLDVFPAALKAFHQRRRDENRMPVQFVMPVGNDNLARCNAFLTPRREGEVDHIEALNWRVQPEDQSANYVEIWSECFSHPSAFSKGEAPVPLELAVVPPGQTEPSFAAGRNGQVRLLVPEGAGPDEQPAGAIYFQVVEDERIPGTCRFRYVIATAPTLVQDGDGPQAPAGVWSIRLRNPTPKRILCIASIQTDQAILPGRAIGLRSYFDDEAYWVYDQDGAHVETGRALESYEFRPDLQTEPRPKNLDLVSGSRVRRHGTMNASAAHAAVARVGGFRASDQRTAPYSATGRGRWNGEDDGTHEIGGETEDPDRKRAPTANLPTDDGPAHFGILSAGAANGSVVAMQGTSFASSQATRCVVRELLAGRDPTYSASATLHRVAKGKDVGPDLGVTQDCDNLDVGRIASPLRPRVNRMGQEDDA